MLSRVGAKPLTVQLANGVPTAVTVRTATSDATASVVAPLMIALLLLLTLWVSKRRNQS